MTWMIQQCTENTEASMADPASPLLEGEDVEVFKRSQISSSAIRISFPIICHLLVISVVDPLSFWSRVVSRPPIRSPSKYFTCDPPFPLLEPLSIQYLPLEPR